MAIKSKGTKPRIYPEASVNVTLVLRAKTLKSIERLATDELKTRTAFIRELLDGALATLLKRP
jgi:hypothetical protein